MLPKPRVHILVSLLITALIISMIGIISYTPESQRRGADYSTANMMQDVHDAKPAFAIDLAGLLSRQYVNPRLKLVDSRTKAEFDHGHIPNALNLPADSSAGTLQDFEKTNGNTQDIVVYCDAITCGASRLLRSRLLADNYQNVFVYAAGIEEWKKCGLHVSNLQ